jgi:hypothetical protein
LEISLNHDRLWRYNFLNLGGGFVFALNESLQLFGSGAKMVWGQNTHPHYGFGVGVNWHFRARRGRVQANQVTALASPGSTLSPLNPR